MQLQQKKIKEILDINEEIKQLKKNSRDPFITAAEITKLKNYEDIVGNNYRLLLNEVDIIISKLEKNFVWNFYKYLYIFLDTVMHGSKIAIYKRNIHIDDLFLDDLFCLNLKSTICLYIITFEDYWKRDY